MSKIAHHLFAHPIIAWLPEASSLEFASHWLARCFHFYQIFPATGWNLTDPVADYFADSIGFEPAGSASLVNFAETDFAVNSAALAAGIDSVVNSNFDSVAFAATGYFEPVVAGFVDFVVADFAVDCFFAAAVAAVFLIHPVFSSRSRN